ncbi:ribosomal protein S6 modification protein [Gammaproteobacteria bacterium]
MKIVLLSRKPDIYSTRRLVEVALARGHEVRVVDTLRCYMNISADHPLVQYEGKALKDFDAVLPRIGISITAYGTAVVRQFERMGIYSLNSSTAITRARDKLHTLQLLAQAGIALPRTGFASAQEDVADLISLVGGAPLVVKLLEGTQGIGVVLAETHQAATSVIEAFYGLRANILVQEFVGEAEGADIRCLVVGGQVIASMKRQAQQGEFRSNLHRGGTASPVRITPQERAMAVKATRTIGLAVAGVDLLRSRYGPMVMEVNASPGLEGIETATGKDVAGAIINYLERRITSGKKRVQD